MKRSSFSLPHAVEPRAAYDSNSKEAAGYPELYLEWEVKWSCDSKSACRLGSFTGCCIYPNSSEML